MKKPLATIALVLAATSASASAEHRSLTPLPTYFEQLQYCQTVTFTNGTHMFGYLYLNGYFVYPGSSMQAFTIKVEYSDKKKADADTRDLVAAGQVPCAAMWESAKRTMKAMQ
jgi:hypothetical protein